MKHIRFTQAGYDALKKEEERLKKLRPSVVQDLKTAREMGDLSENGYYKASRQKLSFVDSSLRRIDFQIKYATIVETETKEYVTIGCTVSLLQDTKAITFEVVGDLEANPSEGKISLLSPLGKALDEKKVGDTASIVTPTRTVIYKIISIK